MIEILYLFLAYLPLTIISLTKLGFLITNNLIFTLIPIINLYKKITPYPFYYDLTAITGNYLLLFIINFILNSQCVKCKKKCYKLRPPKLSNILDISLNFINNFLSLGIFLGVEYIYKFNNIWDSSFGLFLLSLVYIYYPILHRLYLGYNRISFKRKIDYYYSYYRENYQYLFFIEIIESILLGILFLGFYYQFNYIEYIYGGFGLCKIIYLYLKPLNYNSFNKKIYFKIFNIISFIISSSLIFNNIKNKEFYYIGNFGLLFLNNLLFLLIFKPINKHKLIVRESISIPDLYF